MRPLVSANLLFGLLIVLTISSVSLKAAIGPIDDGKSDARRGQIETQLSAMLRSQGFSTSISPRRMQSSIVVAKRGACRLTVRDARAGTAVETVFRREAQGVGPVQYLYRGRSTAEAPAFRMRLGRLQVELLRRLGIDGPVHVPVALAVSPDCGARTFGLEDVRQGA